MCHICVHSQPQVFPYTAQVWVLIERNGPHMVTFLSWTLIFEWYMTRPYLLLFSRYKYQEVPIPWMTPGIVGVESESELANRSTWHYCNKDSSIANMVSMIEETEPFHGPMNYSSALTFRLKRPSISHRDEVTGEEVLEIEYSIDWLKQAIFNVFLYLPQARWDVTSIGCPEFAGYFETDPHVGQSPSIPHRLVFRLGLRKKLKDLGRESLSHIVVTLVGPDAAQQTLAVTNARVMYLRS